MTEPELDAELNELRCGSVKPTLPIIGLVVGAVPFAVSFQTTSKTTVTEGTIETVTSKSAIDYVAVGAGGLAFLLGLVALIQGIRVRNMAVLGLGVAAMALGIFQIARGTVLMFA